MIRIMTDARRFPIMSREGLPKSVPWFLVGKHAQQAIKNHGQTLERLAERGGLDPMELWCVVHNASLEHRPSLGHCETWLSGINDLRSHTVEVEIDLSDQLLV